MPRSLVLPDLVRMLEGGWPFGDHTVRIEDYREDGNYVLRAELPGLDPEKDIKISVHGNELAISAERSVETHDRTHTEFSYGKFARAVQLPAGAQPNDVLATYDAGILQVTVPVKQETPAKEIDIKIGK